MYLIRFCKLSIITLLFLIIGFLSPAPLYAQTVIFNENFESSSLLKWDTAYTRGVPEFVTSDSNIWLKVNVPAFSDFEIQAGNFSWENYLLSLDMIPKYGFDKNIFFRVNDKRSTISGLDIPVSYGLHITTGLIELQKWTETLSGTTPIAKYNTSFPYGAITHIKIAVWENNIKVFINNSLLPQIEYTDMLDPILKGRISLSVKSGTVGTEVWYDNVVVEELSEPVITPSPTPTSTATPTGGTSLPSSSPTSTSSSSPTPTTTSMPTISVPNIKQYTGGWENNFYAFTNQTIKQWGCALTSAVMILRYYGHDVWPNTLNDWLKEQSDGYISSSLVNWLAITRYTKLHDSTSSPTLEYKRLEPTVLNLNNELNNSRPTILKVPGHFVVATKKTGTTYSINDPGYSRYYLNSYNNSFQAINSFKPTHSDLSYMMFVSNSTINMEITGPNGNVVASQKFVEDPINDKYDQSHKSGEPISILMVEKPISGNYKLTISGPTSKYHLDSYLYEVDGKVTLHKFSGILFGNDSDIYNVSYSNGHKTIKLSLNGIINDVLGAYKNKQITSKAIYTTINMYLKMYERYGYQELITTLLNQVKIYTPKYINAEFSEILKQNLENIKL